MSIFVQAISDNTSDNTNYGSDFARFTGTNPFYTYVTKTGLPPSSTPSTSTYLEASGTPGPADDEFQNFFNMDTAGITYNIDVIRIWGYWQIAVQNGSDPMDMGAMIFIDGFWFFPGSGTTPNTLAYQSFNLGPTVPVLGSGYSWSYTDFAASSLGLPTFTPAMFAGWKMYLKGFGQNSKAGFLTTSDIAAIQAELISFSPPPSTSKFIMVF